MAATLRLTTGVVYVRSWSGTLSGASLDLTGDIVVTNTGVGTTTNPAVTIQNTTPAANGAQQYSPRLSFIGQGWKTDATAASQPVEAAWEVRPVQRADEPGYTVNLMGRVNNGTWADLMSFNRNQDGLTIIADAPDNATNPKVAYWQNSSDAANTYGLYIYAAPASGATTDSVTGGLFYARPVGTAKAGSRYFGVAAAGRPRLAVGTGYGVGGYFLGSYALDMFITPSIILTHSVGVIADGSTNTEGTVGRIFEGRYGGTLKNFITGGGRWGFVSGTSSLVNVNESAGIRLQFAAAPTIASGFGTDPSISTGSTDTAGEVNVGTGGIATSGVIAFATTWARAPFVVVTNSTTGAVVRATASTTQLTITALVAFTASDKINWVCIGAQA